MHGAKRVVVFCIMTTVLPTVLIIIPLYLRHVVFADVKYSMAESDVVEISEGISSVFCCSHSVKMNSSFNAFQLKHTPIAGTKRKHIRLKKSMRLPDDTLEYWGFYLLKGATVQLKVCSRYEGSRILVVRGERHLRTCGLLEHNVKKIGATLDQEHNQVKVTFQSADEIDDENKNSIDMNDADNSRNVAVEDTSDEESFSLISDHPKMFNRNNSYARNRISLTKSSNKKKHERHQNKKFYAKQEELYKLQHELQEDEDINLVVNRSKRNIEGHMLDTRIGHGGSAINYTEKYSNENSASSFETDLLTCYNGHILLTEGFSPSHLCTDVHYLENGERMETIHNIVSDGYYYYIFYSDNDFVRNDIHALFDIYKPILKFSNSVDAKSCTNQTECQFDISFWSDESVVVEIPMMDGIDNQENYTLLISTCHPRMTVYIVFPITVMFLILGCAFI